ncbi:aminoglycoside phosphotransferase family protein [Paenibacillus sp. H1-7]|uniref:phosphotransferase n=1 Tax=Paenibacillus sp. H1-7 TaxID=2282849 RepID=UPI001EF7E688|nr:phosphotransferase [Paenibacillus sp. H1-7]ULL17921.1 aminoglycoside phosphotransferase family protein [Paenibacillus sp. H1-7]
MKGFDRYMDSILFDQMVRQDGTLDSSKLVSRETLYVGRNGKAVERFVVENDDHSSFIFKPLTNLETIGREMWVYDHLLPHIPVRFPNLLAQAKHRDADRFWAIYEDLGPLQHRFDRDTLVKAAAAIPSWHQLPMDCLPADFTGHTPKVDVVLNEVREKSELWQSILEKRSVPAYLIDRAARILQQVDDELQSEWTVSHGDYHPLNLSVRNDEIIILDWEYVHLNSMYWDLYNLLDITSPNYRRPEVNASVRNEVLQVYYARRLQLGWSSRFHTFQKNYYRYALIHSLWIMTLIDKDLKAGKLDRDALLEQQKETLAIVTDLLLEENEIRG